MLWNAFRAGILPVKLAALPDIVARFLGHLARANQRAKLELSVDRFLKLLAPEIG